MYNALEALCRSGAVLAAEVGAGPAVYEAAETWHHHAVCRVCGQVTDVACLVGEKPCLSAGGDWGTVEEARVVFSGVCARCSEARSTAPR